MAEAITGAVWAFCWGLAAASGLLGGTILGLIARLPHRAIAAIMSFGAGVLLSGASIKIASEALIVAGAVFTGGGMIAGAALFSIANAALATAKDRKRCGECKPQLSEAEAPGSGTSIALGTALDAVPEALVLGIALRVSGPRAVETVRCTILRCTDRSVPRFTRTAWSGPMHDGAARTDGNRQGSARGGSERRCEIWSRGTRPAAVERGAVRLGRRR